MFEFATATRIVFGRGTSQQLGKLAAPLGRHVLLVTGAAPERFCNLKHSLQAAGLAVTAFTLTSEPRVSDAEQATSLAREAGCDCVVSVGGGSAIDLGKAVAALLTNPGPVLDYLEVVGQGRPLTQRSVPFIAVPTTAGTGAEVTKNAVLGANSHGVKVSLRSDWMLPVIALVDSELTHSLPRSVTAATGLDALTQVLEPYLSRFANPLTDALCTHAIQRARGALPRVVADGKDAAARDDMALVSLFGGLALANAKLGAVHGFAGPIGGLVSAPHGAVCARLLPLVMEVNLRALRERDRENPALARFATVGQLLTGSAKASAEDGISWLTELCQTLQIPALSSYGLGRSQLEDTVAKASRASSMKGNPLTLNQAELVEILERAL